MGDLEENQAENRCFVCLSQAPRYTCPGCKKRTCSLPCVQQHKIDTNCSGRRNAADYVEKKSMGDRMLLSDYRFLEDGGRKLFSLQKEFTEHTLFKPYPKGSRKTLFEQANNRGFVLWGLPIGMARRAENTTTFGPISRNNKQKCFKFHIRWTFVLESGKVVVVDKNVLETWNIGRLVEESIDKLPPANSAPFINNKVKVEVKEEHGAPDELESDENGHMSASSIDSGKQNDQDRKTLPIELGMCKYSYDVFMKRVQGPEKYYHIDRDKSIRENLNGRVIVEYPEFIIAQPEHASDFFEKLTNQVDYKRGQKAPVRPGAKEERPKGKGKKDLSRDEKPDGAKNDRANLYDWKANKRPHGGKKQKVNFNSSVDLSNVALKEWQKEALKRASVQNKKHESYKTEWCEPTPKPDPVKTPVPAGHVAVKEPVWNLNVSPVKKAKTEDERNKEAEERKRTLQSAMKFFNTNEISSDEEEEEDD